jgi:hypothetical protein
MSWDSGFHDEYQDAAMVVPYGQQYSYQPGYYDEELYSRSGERRMSRRREKAVIEGLYDHGRRFEHEEPLHYRRADKRHGIPDRGLGNMLSDISISSGMEEEREGECFSLVKSMSKSCKDACARSSVGESTRKKAFESLLDETHSSMSAKYAESKITKDPRKLREVPVTLSASCVDVEIPKAAGVVIVNEKKFSKIQESKFGRDETCQKKYQSSAINYMRGLTGMDFSMITNPNVEKKISSLVLKNTKTGKPAAKLSPYIMWDNSTSVNSPELLVDKSEGFPSIIEKEEDNVLEAGYMVTILDKGGIRINGNYGGKNGKVMQLGQSLYYGDVLVFPARAKRMPVWIRVASNRPSELTGKENNVVISHMDAKMVPLRVGRPASQMKGFSGKAVRKLKVTNVSGSSSAAKKKGEDTRIINATLRIDFES